MSYGVFKKGPDELVYNMPDGQPYGGPERFFANNYFPEDQDDTWAKIGITEANREAANHAIGVVLAALQEASFVGLHSVPMLPSLTPSMANLLDDLGENRTYNDLYTTTLPPYVVAQTIRCSLAKIIPILLKGGDIKKLDTSLAANDSSVAFRGAIYPKNVFNGQRFMTDETIKTLETTLPNSSVLLQPIAHALAERVVQRATLSVPSAVNDLTIIRREFDKKGTNNIVYSTLDPSNLVTVARQVLTPMTLFFANINTRTDIILDIKQQATA